MIVPFLQIKLRQHLLLLYWRMRQVRFFPSAHRVVNQEGSALQLHSLKIALLSITCRRQQQISVCSVSSTAQCTLDAHVKIPFCEATKAQGGLEILQEPVARAVLRLVLGSGLFVKLYLSQTERCGPEVLS